MLFLVKTVSKLFRLVCSSVFLEIFAAIVNFPYENTNCQTEQQTAQNPSQIQPIKALHTTAKNVVVILDPLQQS